MELTKAEKVAGRWFRDTMQQTLDDINTHQPVKAKCSRSSPPYFRHACTRAGGTVAMRLRDTSVLSPAIAVYRDGDGKLKAVESRSWSESLGEVAVIIAEGLFVFTWLEGGCHATGCGFTVRSGTGLFKVTEAADNGGQG